MTSGAVSETYVPGPISTPTSNRPVPGIEDGMPDALDAPGAEPALPGDVPDKVVDEGMEDGVGVAASPGRCGVTTDVTPDSPGPPLSPGPPDSPGVDEHPAIPSTTPADNPAARAPRKAAVGAPPKAFVEPPKAFARRTRRPPPDIVNG